MGEHSDRVGGGVGCARAAAPAASKTMCAYPCPATMPGMAQIAIRTTPSI